MMQYFQSLAAFVLIPLTISAPPLQSVDMTTTTLQYMQPIRAVQIVGGAHFHRPH